MHWSEQCKNQGDAPVDFDSDIPFVESLSSHTFHFIRIRLKKFQNNLLSSSNEHNAEQSDRQDDNMGTVSPRIQFADIHTLNVVNSKPQGYAIFYLFLPGPEEGD